MPVGLPLIRVGIATVHTHGVDKPVNVGQGADQGPVWFLVSRKQFAPTGIQRPFSDEENPLPMNERVRHLLAVRERI
ncbi:hypothetical protein SAMN05444167_1088 [Terriglobus roseus]|uniref:Uncharacterized protein n=1 Tax=Terriglobus roseus TaxID=392734 RepID=A0A1G7HIW6_9BACT|nr:hypothetical protein SAMN05444167_1088 [Terriglobus roseus]